MRLYIRWKENTFIFQETFLLICNKNEKGQIYFFLMMIKLDGDKSMKSLINIFSVLLGFFLLGVLITGLYFLIRSAINSFNELDAHIASVIYVSVLTFLFSSTMIVVILRSGQKRRSIERMQMEKAAVYQRLLAAWSNVLSQSDMASTQSALRIANDPKAAEHQLLLWGSNNVIRHYTTYQTHGTPHNLRDSSVLLLIEKILQEMRKDLGQSNVGIQTGDLLNLLIGTARHDDNSMNTTVQGTRMAHRLFNGVSCQGAE